MQKDTTWIEVVVLIILIIVSIVIFGPAFFRPISEHTGSVHCRSNLDQIGKSLAVYSADLGCYPQRDGAGFLTALYQEGFLQEPRVFVCPSTQESHDSRQDDEQRLIQQLMTLQTPEPSSNNVISYAGRKNYRPSIYPGIFTTVDSQTTSIASDDWQGERNHEEVTAVLFLDGHVDYIHDKDRSVDLIKLLDPLAN